MFSQFCDLCRKTTKLQFVTLQRYYRKNSRHKRVKLPEIPKAVEGQTPIISCKRKEFNFYERQKYPKYAPIPLATKGWHHYKSKGDHFLIYPLTNEKEANCKPEEEEDDTFTQFGLNPKLIEILERYDITKPMEIQTIGLPIIMNGANTVIAAETGCGKTLTYLLPMIDKIYRWKTLTEKRYNSPLGLIVTPSRELAVQIGVEAKKICQYLDISIKTLTGGRTKKMLLNPPVGEVDIIIASFGIISKLATLKIYKLDMIKSIVLDEADALFHETFEEKLQVFLKRLPLGFKQNVDNNTELPLAAQFTLASATMPSRMSEVLHEIINVDSLVNVTSDKLHHIIVPQKFIRVGSADKPVELLKYIKPKVAQKEQVIIFTNKSTTCNWISQFLEASNIQVACLHGNMPLYVRKDTYARFKSGKCQVLCTTNAGSRGLDTVTVRHVLNYEFPTATADYIHRCGRTGRAGDTKDCRVTSFISTKREIGVVSRIERAVRKMKPIPIFDISEINEDKDLQPFELEPYKEENVQEEFSIPY